MALPNHPFPKTWLQDVAISENYKIAKLHYSFLCDEELLLINQQFLKHDTYTDVITFDYNQGELVIGEIYISLDRIRENALLLQKTFDHEFYRILVHGLLHLLGYKDKNPKDKQQMTSKEDYYLSLLTYTGR
jgi:rRNA maturation RNase YbeY